MSTLARRRIRLKLDAAKRTAYRFEDVKATATPELWKGNDVQFEIGVHWGDVLQDVSNLASITLTIRESTVAGAVLATKTLSSGDLDNTLTAETWADDTNQHALIPFTGTEMEIAAGAHWLVVSVTTTDSPGRSITLGASTILIAEDGTSNDSAAQVAAALAYTKDESDARYVQKSEDLAWVRRYNGRDYVYIESTGLWYPRIAVIQDGVPVESLGTGVTL
jgi:hypothetical protein